jgi:CRISPR-associated protein Cas1
LEAIERTFTRESHDPTIAIVDGYGCYVGVNHGELVVRDGLGPYRRERLYPRPPHGLRRLVVVGDAKVTTAALRWCKATNVAVAILDPDLKMLLSSATGVEDARIRRQQATAPTNEIGLAIAKTLLGAKLRGAARNARKTLLRPEAADIETFVTALSDADDLDDCRSLEAVAAEVYWRCWSDNPATALRFARTDVSRGRIPEHWRRFDARRSLLGTGNSNRRAERPLNALLNLGYRLAEIEVRLQCLAMGIDPSFGVVHLDRPGRDGMVLDILEVTRSAVEAHVLGLVEQRTFRRCDFEQAPNGAVRVLMPLSHEVSVAMKAFGQTAAPYVEEVRNLLADGVETKIGRPTPLSRRQNRAGAAAVKARKALAASRAQADGSKRPSQRSTSTAWVCLDCGGAVTERHRVRCDACIDRDPRQTPELRATRAAAISARRQAEAAWEGAGLDPELFRSMVLPALATVKLSAIVEACGVAKGTASNWRTGKSTPHPSHWSKLAELARG